MTDEEETRATLRALWRRIVERPEADVRERMRAHGFLDAGGAAPARPDARQAEATARPPAAADTTMDAASADAAVAERGARASEHLGDGVGARLAHTRSDAARLSAAGAPVLHDLADLARALGVDARTLRWLTFHRRGATLVHYHRYEVPKKSGGARAISAPKRQLKEAQHWVLRHVLDPLAVSTLAHGFVQARSIVTNARPHVRRAVVVNMDLRDFFPSIDFRRVRGVFASLGYSGQVSTLLALLCTEPPRVRARVDGDPDARVRYVAVGERQLPQGAPTSPAVTNLLCRRLDARLAGAARALGYVYTRYADDLTFSGDDVGAVGVLLARARQIVTDEGLTEHPDKTRVMRRGRRQEVTGLVVNDRPTVPRAEVRRLRAILHNARRSGLESQNRDGHPTFLRYLEGKIAYVKMVDPRRGAQLSLMLQRVLAGAPDH